VYFSVLNFELTSGFAQIWGQNRRKFEDFYPDEGQSVRIAETPGFGRNQGVCLQIVSYTKKGNPKGLPCIISIR